MEWTGLIVSAVPRVRLEECGSCRKWLLRPAQEAQEQLNKRCVHAPIVSNVAAGTFKTHTQLERHQARNGDTSMPGLRAAESTQRCAGGWSAHSRLQLKPTPNKTR